MRFLSSGTSATVGGHAVTRKQKEAEWHEYKGLRVFVFLNSETPQVQATEIASAGKWASYKAATP